MTRLTDDRRIELFCGVLELVADRGYDKVTMDQVAERTHSSKATLYRQWGSKARLVVEAITCCAGAAAELPDTGSLQGDLHAMVLQKPRPDESAIPPDLITSLLPALKTDPELAEAVRTDIIDAFVRDLGIVVGHAVERGEVPDDPEALQHAAVAFMAPFLLHHVVHDVEPGDDDLLAYLDAVILPALGAR
ncbi:TetR/AcrR family transcriptional regulator [Aeromicrobium sp. CTD01-1L150]|uniref:TetR/AcrR family transcriptional regulator n=1 Tax=Aeromicrobium sp. CTD01-1L150 TaxID=3341830 RepID=UPI0035C00E93